MKPKHLLVFSFVEHHHQDGKIVGHGGFVREINIWAEIFETVTVAGVYSSAEARSDDIPYKYENIHFTAISDPVSTDGVWAKLRFLLKLPFLLSKGMALVTPDSVLMARGPDPIGFLAVLVAWLTRRPRFAKYAAQWTGYQGEPAAYRWQRQVYGSKFFGGPVIVNARPDKQKLHIISLYNASMSRNEWENAAEFIKKRGAYPPYRLVFVGRITPVKGLDILLKAVKALRDLAFDVTVDIIGDGSEKLPMEQLSLELGLSASVTFRGWLGRDELKDFYANAFCLVSCSRHQGLDKVLIEAMTYAVPIIATDVSVIPDIINPPECGLVVKPDDIAALVQAIQHLISNPAEAQQMGQRGRQKVSQMLLDDMPRKYREFLQTHLSIEFEHQA